MAVVKKVPDTKGNIPKCFSENKGVHCVSVRKSTIETSENEVIKVMLGVAEGSLKETELAIWLEMNSIPV
jgi:hypothetical protein